MKSVIVFNAPPNSGKDVSADYLAGKYELNHIRFKDQLYIEAAREANLEFSQMKELASNRDTKEVPNELFGGRSPRQWLIHVSEDLIKPDYGKDYFGQTTADKLLDGISVISDGGFEEELIPITKEADIVYVVRIHREGCSFEGDSRKYFTDKFLISQGVYIMDVINNSSLQDLYDQLEYIYQDVFDLGLQFDNKGEL